jgi:2-dehydropantoate 2-reductase
MRICVYGAGAVGGHLAARLAAAGNDVSVVTRGPQLEAVRRNGIRLIHGEEEIHGRVKAAEQPAELGPQDLVVVTMKANTLFAVAEKIASLLKSDTAVVFAQNGIPWWYEVGLNAGLAASRPRPPDLSRLDPGGRLKKAVAPERLMGAVIYSANDVVEPGVIRNHTAGNNMLVVGECDDRGSSRISALRAILEKAGISSPPADDIRQAIWNKAVGNLGTSTLALLTGEPLTMVRADPGLRELLERIGSEGKQIAAAHGVDSERAPERPSGGYKSGNISHKPSMLQDYERGRPMEIESQLATPLAFARQAGVVTPTLDALIPLAVHKAAAKGLYTT